MSAMGTYTLPKEERLCSKTLIEQLFSDHPSKKKGWPVKAVYQVTKRKDEQESQVEVLVSVSKRQFKRAVKRNFVKRQLREAYRLNKIDLWNVMEQHPEAKLNVAFLWLDSHLHSSENVNKAVVSILENMAKDVRNLLESVG